MKWMVAALTALTASAVTPAPAQAAPVCAPGEHTVSVTFQNQQYPVTIYLPAGKKRGERLPIVLNLHGTQSTGSNQLQYSDMKLSADAGRYLVLAPSGAIPAAAGFAWNVPGTGTPPEGARDDIAYLDEVIKTAVRSWCGDPTRVYGTGYSGGGRMLSAFACRSPQRLAAIAPVAGLRAGRPDPFNPTRPDPSSCTPLPGIPVLTFHGEQDWTNPFQGGGSPYWGYSVPAAQERWADINGCHPRPRTTTVTETVSKTTYRGCRRGADVVLYTIADGGHTWPGTPVDNGNGVVTHDISANNLMWSFFQHHRLPRH
jgi:polyhydroxybutyrate depolymerase